MRVITMNLKVVLAESVNHYKKPDKNETLCEKQTKNKHTKQTGIVQCPRCNFLKEFY